MRACVCDVYVESLYVDVWLLLLVCLSSSDVRILRNCASIRPVRSHKQS